MIMTTRQQIVTAFLAVLIVGSVMSMPRPVDAPRNHAATHAAGAVAAAPAVTAENREPVKDLTYN